MKKLKEIKIIKNLHDEEHCWVCNNDGYITAKVPDESGDEYLTILNCNCCERGTFESDSTSISDPVSKYFDINKLINKNKFRVIRGRLVETVVKTLIRK
jgi:hypothetical protein